MDPRVAATVEGTRLATSSEAQPGPWKAWGAYLSERAWGTVREDYSADGDAWSYFPHDHARSRAYRWSEDGMAGICDLRQHLCLSVGLWNGRDPIVKERMFGLNGKEGNHGEDVKECWWYTDATPTHSWLSWRYHYPQAEFPYQELLDENRRRTRHDPEYELVDTGVFDEGRYWIVTVDHAKAGPEDVCTRIRVHNHGPDEATIHVLPTLWFRNTWSWGGDDPETAVKPSMRVEGHEVVTGHPRLAPMRMTISPDAAWLVCDNETNVARVFGREGEGAAYPKDAINDTVVSGVDVTNPVKEGTKAAAHHVLTVPAGGTAEVRVRLQRSDVRAPGSATDLLTSDFDAVMAARQREADEFHAAVAPPGTTDDEALVLRQACAGMVWGQQFFHYDVATWLAGDPSEPPPPPGRGAIRNGTWRHLKADDVMTMPDPWEFPWFASWDLALQCVAIAHIDPEFAKHQLVLLCREWFMHPGGQLPAYEWSFSDVNPPVHAWAALRVFEIDGGTDHQFLERVFHKLLINFTWWVNRTDAEGNNVFEGGFLGLDNIGPFNRSGPAPVEGVLEQSDATAWMAMYCVNMLTIALRLTKHDLVYEDVATKFVEHFAYIATAMNASGMWDEVDGFYYDIVRSDGGTVPVRVRSIVGLIPLFAMTVIPAETFDALPDFAARVDWFVAHERDYSAPIGHLGTARRRPGEPLLLSLVSPERLQRIIATAADPDEFLSPHGLRALSRYHREHPFTIGDTSVDYEPGESTSWLYGGNSNWRGPVWMPVNTLAVEALHAFGAHLGDRVSVAYPNDGAGRPMTLSEVADDLRHRLTAIFLRGDDGRRPVHGPYDLLATDPAWRDLVFFHEYFHGETGAGLGASHQTGWTGLVIDLIIRYHRATR